MHELRHFPDDEHEHNSQAVPRPAGCAGVRRSWQYRSEALSRRRLERSGGAQRPRLHARVLVVVQLLGALAVDDVPMPFHRVSTVWGSASQTRVACDIGVRTSLAPDSTDTGPSYRASRCANPPGSELPRRLPHSRRSPPRGAERAAYQSAEHQPVGRVPMGTTAMETSAALRGFDSASGMPSRTRRPGVLPSRSSPCGTGAKPGGCRQGQVQCSLGDLFDSSAAAASPSDWPTSERFLTPRLSSARRVSFG